MAVERTLAEEKALLLEWLVPMRASVSRENEKLKNLTDATETLITVENQISNGESLPMNSGYVSFEEKHTDAEDDVKNCVAALKRVDEERFKIIVYENYLLKEEVGA